MTDDSKTILYVVLIGGILYMVAQSSKQEKEEVNARAMDAVKKGEFPSLDKAKEDPAYYDPAKKMRYEEFLKLLDEMNRTVKRWFLYCKGLQSEGETRIPDREYSFIEQTFSSVKYLQRTAEEFGQVDTPDKVFQGHRQNLQDLYDTCEWMVNFANQRSIPPAVDALYRFGDKTKSKRSSTDEDVDILDSFSSVSPETNLSDDDVAKKQKGETEGIQSDFEKGRSASDEVMRRVEGDEKGQEATSVTTDKRNSAFVDNDGGENDDELSAKVANRSGLTTNPTKDQAPQRVATQPSVSGEAGNEFDSAPMTVNATDSPPALPKPRRKKPKPSKTPPEATKRDEDRDSTRDAFNASHDTVVGKPTATAEELLENIVSETGRVDLRQMDAGAREILGERNINSQEYRQQLRTLLEAFDNFIQSHPTPTQGQRANAKALRNKVFYRIPWENIKLFHAAHPLLGPMFYTPVKAGSVGKPDNSYAFTAKQIEEVRNYQSYRDWAKALDHAWERCREFIKTVPPTENATELARQHGHTGKRRKASGGVKTRSQSRSLSRVR